MSALVWLRDASGWTADSGGDRYWITGQAPAFHVTVLLGGDTTKAQRRGGDLGYFGSVEAAKAACEAHHAKSAR